MLNNSKYISTFSIIERVIRDSGYDDISFSDVVEWLWEVLGYLEIPLTLIDDNCYVDVTDYKGILPSNLESIQQVRDYYSQIPLIKVSDIFYKSPNKTKIDNNNAYLNGEGETINLDTNNVSASSRYGQYTYKIEDGMIYTEYQKVRVEIAYKRFPVDDKGFPIVPQDAKLIRALKNYIIMMMDKRAWRKQLIPQSVYAESSQDYYVAAAAVQSYSMMPDLAEMEKIRRFSSLLVSDTNNYDKSFKYLGG